MSKSVKKEILASEYSSEQVLAVNTTTHQVSGKVFFTEVRLSSSFFELKQHQEMSNSYLVFSISFLFTSRSNEKKIWPKNTHGFQTYSDRVPNEPTSETWVLLLNVDLRFKWKNGPFWSLIWTRFPKVRKNNVSYLSKEADEFVTCCFSVLLDIRTLCACKSLFQS